MNTLPQDIKLHEFYRHLPYSDILNLCQTNSEFNLICQNNSVWEQLLNRDFGVYNARNLYILYVKALDKFSKIYPIITQRALQTIVNNIPILIWDNLEIILQEYQEKYNNKILTVDIIIDSIYGRNELILRQHQDVIYQLSDISLEPYFDDLADALYESNCRKFLSFISKPTTIFVNKNPIVVRYDYDLAYKLTNYIDVESCYQQLQQIENEISHVI